MAHKLENAVRVAELAPYNTLKRIGLSDGKVLCDIGAGTGVFTLPAYQMSKSLTYAVEISEEMCKVLREKSGAIDVVENINAVPDACCDIALLCTVLHELSDIPEMTFQISRTLKTRGVLAVIEFHKRQTPMGPPVERRLSEQESILAIGSGFTLEERFDLGENFYCLIFSKGL